MKVAMETREVSWCGTPEVSFQELFGSGVVNTILGPLIRDPGRSRAWMRKVADPTMAMTDGIYVELQREIDGFVAAHGSILCGIASAASIREEIAENGRLEAPLSRVRWVVTVTSDSQFCETIQCLLSWLAAVDDAGQCQDNGLVRAASWLVAYLVGEILLKRNGASSGQFSPSVTVEAVEKMVERVLDRCVVVFQETYSSEAARAVESGGGFFAFKPATTQFKAPTPESTLQDSVANAWRHVAALVSLGSLSPFTVRLRHQLLQHTLEAKNPNSKDLLLLKNLSGLRLGFDVAAFLWPTNPQQKAKDAAQLLKMLQPLMLKPHKSPTRLAAISAIASILNQELKALDARGLQRLYSSIHSAAEWISCITDLHSSALKLCGKREFAVATWEMRIAVLSVTPNEIFSRYWKEDTHALLRVQYQHNKEGGSNRPQSAVVLDCVERCFTHVLKRHFLNDRRIPGESDCMEIINTAQAWCFFSYPKHRSLERLREQVIPALVKISVSIASYNMLYAVQSHVRRLLLEADHIFDEKKLVGLESLVALCKLSLADGAPRDPSLPLDRKTLLANRITLGELIGQTLIEANALLGGELLIESATGQASGSGGGVWSSNLATSSASKLLRDEYRRSIGIQSYVCALTSLQFLYTALELSDDQKVLILVRSCIHKDTSVRESASAALHRIIRDSSQQASVIFRGITEFILRLSNHLTTAQDVEAFVVLVELVASLLRLITVNDPTDPARSRNPWEHVKAREESLLQIESVAVHLLVFEDSKLLTAAVSSLEAVAQARAKAFRKSDDANAEVGPTVERPSVIDVLRKADSELRELLFCFESQSVVNALGTRDLGYFRQLISNLPENPRAGFRWSIGLSVAFGQLAIWNPEVAAFMWPDVNDKVAKLEPAMPSLLLESNSPSTDFNLARWRNLALLATTTACPNFLVQSSSCIEDPSERDAEDAKDCSVQSVISSSAVQALLKRLCRYLRSPALEQKKSAVLVLGSTHVSSLPILIEVLQKYETEAFTPIEMAVSSRHGSLQDIQPPVAFIMNGVANGVGPRRVTKEQKLRNLKLTAQLNLQWALGRCYRLLLQSTQPPLVFDDSTQEALLRLQVGAMGVINRLGAALASLQDHQPGQTTVLDGRDAPHLVFMMQQDFCSSVRLLAALLRDNQSPSLGSARKRKGAGRCRSSNSLKRSALASAMSTSASIGQDFGDNVEIWSAFDHKQRENWYFLLLNWCQSFSSLANARLGSNLSGSFFAFDSPARDHWLQRCDVLGERFEDSVIPWQWVDEADVTSALGIQEAAMASFQRYFLCQTAFATISVLVEGSLFVSTPVTQDAAVFRWLDECFSVDVGQPTSLSTGISIHHFQILQQFCHRVLSKLLESDFHSFAEVCVDKSFFSATSGDKHSIAKHYFRALCEVAGRLRRAIRTGVASQSSFPDVNEGLPQFRLQTPGLKNRNLEVKLCHAILMHLGVENDPTHRGLAVDLINMLYADEGDYEITPFRLNTRVTSAKRSNAVFGAQVVNRMQIAGASFLVRKLTPLAYQMSMSMLKFLSCCELSQQKKTLAAVLPWLAEVSLASRCGSSVEEPATVSAFDADQLLSLLFRITTNLGASCSERLEHVWLTLAFAEPVTSVVNGADCEQRETNLSRVLQFLFMQRTTSIRLSTAKIVVWWLARWQSAAHDVLRELLVIIDTRRRESAELQPAPGSNVPTVQPVDDVFVFVILASDSCCHLTSVPAYLYEHPSMRESMMIQAVHLTFLAVFALVLNPSAFAVRRPAASPSGGAVEDHQHHQIYDDVFNDCLVLLRNLVSQLYGPSELLEQVVDDLSSLWSSNFSTEEPSGVGTKPVASGTSTQPLEESMVEFASYLPVSSRRLWALECVKEVTLALVPGSTVLQQTSSRCNNVQVLCCVRFGLLGYRVLAPEFHGDVLLTLLDLLHHALDEHARSPVDAGAVLCETLKSLRSMVSAMPSQKLALYPQLLWVCVALLNHGKSELQAFQIEVLHLLVEIISMPHFATNELLHNVLLSKKPQQWKDFQASVLRTIVWCLDRGPPTIQMQILRVVGRFLAIPFALYHADAVEHLVISSIALLPYVTAIPKDITTPKPQSDPDSDDQEDQESLVYLDPLRVATDLRFAWLAIGSNLMSEVLSSLQSSLAGVEDSPEHGTDLDHEIVRHFATAFVSELINDESHDALITISFEILVKILAAEEVRKRGTACKFPDEVVAATLWIVEGMLSELSHQQIAWHPPVALLGSVARLVRQPEQTQTWQAAIRILSLIGASH